MQQFGEFFINHWDLFLILAITLAMLGFNLFGARLRGYQETDPMIAVQLMNHRDALFLDVREEAEIKSGLVPDALHIPLGKLVSRIQELEKYKDRPVIVGCRSGHRSARGCAILRKHGFETVYNLRGGVMAWVNANLPLHKGGKRKNKK